MVSNKADPSILSTACGEPTDSDPTWKWVQNKINDCKQNPNHCDGVDTPNYRWVVGDNNPKKGYTLFAGQRIKGIECPIIWQHTDPDYWEAAWKEALKRPLTPANVGLAINAKACRQREQFHIHMCTIDSGVQSILLKNESQITDDPKKWKQCTLKLKPGVASYRVLRTLDFRPAQMNLFQVLWMYVLDGTEKEKDAEMANQSLVVCAKQRGFFIINGKHGEGTGAGTDLLDTSCG